MIDAIACWGQSLFLGPYSYYHTSNFFMSLNRGWHEINYEFMFGKNYQTETIKITQEEYDQLVKAINKSQL